MAFYKLGDWSIISYKLRSLVEWISYRFYKHGLSTIYTSRKKYQSITNLRAGEFMPATPPRAGHGVLPCIAASRKLVVQCDYKDDHSDDRHLV